jgi:hypothetical protein
MIVSLIRFPAFPGIAMPLSNQSQDEEVRKGIRKLRELLDDPVKFEKWANETLDMSNRLRRARK